jgi:hypothetical protein
MRILLAGLAVLVGASALAGCDGNTTEQQALADGDERGTDLADQAQRDVATAGSSDPNSAIATAAAIVDAIDSAESDQASTVIAAAPANPDAPSARANQASRALDLASDLQAAGQANRAQLQALLAARGISPVDDSVSLAVRDQAMRSLAQLSRDPPADVAFDYAQLQVITHEEAFVLVGGLAGDVADPAFHSFLVATQAAIASQRDAARSVLRRF